MYVKVKRIPFVMQRLNCHLWSRYCNNSDWYISERESVTGRW